MSHPISDALIDASAKMLEQIGARPAVIRMTTNGLQRLRDEAPDSRMLASDARTFDGIRIEIDDRMADADIQIAPPNAILARDQVVAIQTELRRIADSFDINPPTAGITVLESAVIVDDDSAFKLAIEITPYE